MVNTNFEKSEEHRVTYDSGGGSTGKLHFVQTMQSERDWRVRGSDGRQHQMVACWMTGGEE